MLIRVEFRSDTTTEGNGNRSDTPTRLPLIDTDGIRYCHFVKFSTHGWSRAYYDVITPYWPCQTRVVLMDNRRRDIRAGPTSASA